MDDVQPAGPTGEFPDGKLDESDNGEIAIRIAADQERRLVAIDFGTPVKWLALPPEHAVALAKLLLEKTWSLKVLDTWTIYYNPTDYPEKYVLRRRFVKDGTPTADENCTVCDCLEEARCHVPPGKVCLQEQWTEETPAVESWI